MKAHKHAELIKEWADSGKQVQRYVFQDDCWLDCIDNRPAWKDNEYYRFKPETKIYEYRRYILDDEIKVLDRSKCHEDANYLLFFDPNVRWIDNEWISSEINI